MKGFLQSASAVSDSVAQTAANAITEIDDDDDERQEGLMKLREHMETFCKNVENLKNINKVTKDILAVEEGNKEELLNQWDEKVSAFAPDVSDNKYLQEYDQRVELLIKSAAKSQGTQGDDEELQVAGDQNMNLMCPISKAKMTEPVKNSICGHVYDKNSVLSLLKVNKRMRCPMVGCKNKKFLSLDHLQADLVTQMCMETDSM